MSFVYFTTSQCSHEDLCVQHHCLVARARAHTSPPLIPEVSTVIQNNQSEAIYLKVNRHPASLRLHSQVSPNCPLRPHKCQNDLCVFCFRVGNPLSSSCRPPQVKCSEVATCLLSPCSCVRVCWGGVHALSVPISCPFYSLACECIKTELSVFFFFFSFLSALLCRSWDTDSPPDCRTESFLSVTHSGVCSTRFLGPDKSPRDTNAGERQGPPVQDLENSSFFHSSFMLVKMQDFRVLLWRSNNLSAGLLFICTASAALYHFIHQDVCVCVSVCHCSSVCAQASQLLQERTETENGRKTEKEIKGNLV